jgi:hypothetical protein
MVEGPGADSEEKHEPVSDIDTAAADSLKVLDLKRPIREADSVQAEAGLPVLTPMYGPAAFRKRDCAWVAEVADMYPACLIGSRAVALMGIRTHLWSH